jgi:hypothetical protein
MPFVKGSAAVGLAWKIPLNPLCQMGFSITGGGRNPALKI